MTVRPQLKGLPRRDWFDLVREVLQTLENNGECMSEYALLKHIGRASNDPRFKQMISMSLVEIERHPSKTRLGDIKYVYIKDKGKTILKLLNNLQKEFES